MNRPINFYQWYRYTNYHWVYHTFYSGITGHMQMRVYSVKGWFASIYQSNKSRNTPTIPFYLAEHALNKIQDTKLYL